MEYVDLFYEKNNIIEDILGRLVQWNRSSNPKTLWATNVYQILLVK